ncbi:MAG: hypothetical protein AB1779_06150 [Candidatus Thermoplasmatota archaeon]
MKYNDSPSLAMLIAEKYIIAQNDDKVLSNEDKNYYTEKNFYCDNFCEFHYDKQSGSNINR